MHGISRGTVYRGTHFLGPNFNQNRLIFIFLMPTVNRVGLKTFFSRFTIKRMVVKFNVVISVGTNKLAYCDHLSP